MFVRFMKIARGLFSFFLSFGEACMELSISVMSSNDGVYVCANVSLRQRHPFCVFGVDLKLHSGALKCERVVEET